MATPDFESMLVQAEGCCYEVQRNLALSLDSLDRLEAMVSREEQELAAAVREADHAFASISGQVSQAGAALEADLAAMSKVIDSLKEAASTSGADLEGSLQEFLKPVEEFESRSGELLEGLRQNVREFHQQTEQIVGQAAGFAGQVEHELTGARTAVSRLTRELEQAHASLESQFQSLAEGFSSHHEDARGQVAQLGQALQTSLTHAEGRVAALDDELRTRARAHMTEVGNWLAVDTARSLTRNARELHAGISESGQQLCSAVEPALQTTRETLRRTRSIVEPLDALEQAAARARQLEMGS